MDPQDLALPVFAYLYHCQQWWVLTCC